ncbi:glutamate-5-semialdehyde dehydrogenase [Cystoisospora suis]|uniref:glutamate-5-semialdehyde dehydrogenase n=1 Tax=Cystoisospora suis TaxID=483139 RepID=A0A2C6KF77_9APIC|nr:glutamate-5-semialdehyde dehydrogenase [Cystoisospora suis]
MKTEHAAPSNGTMPEISSVLQAAKKARQAAQKLQTTTLQERNAVLTGYRDGLLKFRGDIEAANAADIKAASAAVATGELSSSLFSRLECTGSKFESLLAGLDALVYQSDPLGFCDLARELADGLELFRVSCPIGVIAVIYEARPEAAVQIAGLAMKSGNALILKGGKEASASNRAIYEALKWGLNHAGMPESAIQLLEGREEVAELLSLDTLVDLVIPRGSKSLVQHVKRNTRIPVLGHADGLCSVYVDADADVPQAIHIVKDSKLQYMAACNAAESLLVHEACLTQFFPDLVAALGPLGVKFKVDSAAAACVPPDFARFVEPAKEEDFFLEWLAPVLAVKTVRNVDEAIAHINAHGSHHTDCIITKNPETADVFMKGVDSAGVYCNCSTRFADGFRYGFGAEVGVSTERVHARGPVGLDGLVTYKYRLYGQGQAVGDVADGKVVFTHKTLKGKNDGTGMDSIEDIADRYAQRLTK